MEEKHAGIEPGQEALESGAVEAGTLSSGGAFEAFEDAGLVALGLEPADEPGADVGQALVIEIDRILRGQHHSQTEGAGLLEQIEQRTLGGRVGDRREEPENLVHVKQSAQAAGPRLGSHPGPDAIQDQGDHPLALGVAEVGDREDRDPGPARRRVEQALDIQRVAFAPAGEAGRSQHLVETQRQLEPLSSRIKRLEIHHPHSREGRGLDLLDQRAELGGLLLAPMMPQKLGHQDRRAVLDRIRRQAGQAEEAGHG